jgi:hypothetical protein
MFIGFIFIIIGVMICFYGLIRGTIRLKVGENRGRVTNFWAMLGWSSELIGSVLQHTGWAYVSAFFLALSIYFWWNSGGGDGMKTKIKNFVQKITPQPLVLARIT